MTVLSVTASSDCAPASDPSTPVDSGCSTVANEMSEGVFKASHLTAKGFRRLYPAPDNLDSLIGVRNLANSILLEKAKNGLRDDVHFMEANGRRSVGYDEFFSLSPVKFREVRENSETIVVGQVVCSRAGVERFECENTDIDIGLNFGIHELTPEAITSIEVSSVTCGGDSCASYVIDQADVMMLLDRKFITSSPHANHNIYTLVVTRDGTPFSFREIHWADGKLDGPEATYLYSYDTTVKPFDLPENWRRMK